MANTGNQVVINLQKKNLTTDTLVVPAIYKPNTPGDPDYILPGANPVACPIDTTLSCPIVRAAKKGADGIQYEFSLPESVLSNPAVAKITVIIYTPGPITVSSQDYTDFTINYFRNSVMGLDAGFNYSMSIQYKNNVDAVIGGCEGLIDVTLDSVITWERITPACQTYPSCAPGWTLDVTGTQCEQVTTAPPDAPTGGGGTPGVAEGVSSSAWNRGGGRVYLPGYPLSGDGTLDVALVTSHLWTNGVTPFDANNNIVDGRMNAAGVWPVGGAPVGEWVGFARQITTSVAKTVFIGMSADNRFRFALNGVDIVSNAGTLAGGGPNFNFWNIYPVNLPPGVNFIEMYGLNDGSVAGFAVEIYDCTLTQLQAVTTEAELNTYIIFSSRDVRGQNFDLGVTTGYHCDPGWVLDNSDPDPDNWVCKQIVREDPTIKNTGLKVWQYRRRLVNTVPDGYEEANDIDGIGPYFAPEEDHITCAIDETTDICITPVFSTGSLTFYSTDAGVAFAVPNNVVIEWMYQVDGGAWVLGPAQTILSTASASTPYVIPGGGGTELIIIILSFTPDADGVYNYQQCLPL